MNVQFAFSCCISAILTFLKATNPTKVHKGLTICRFVTNRLEPLSLQSSYLTQELKIVHIQHPARSLLEAAVSIATQCPSKTLRQRSAQFLTKFVNKFAWSDRFHLVFYLINTVEHSGVVGHMTVYFKDKLAEILQGEPPLGSHVFLKPSNFEKLLRKCIALPQGSETDLLSEYDRIMASLNLLRFLFLRDTNNKTGIWEQVPTIEIQFLNLLRTDINLSRMHFREELKKQSLPVKGEQAPTPEFTINGVSLPSLPPKHRVQMLQSAIHSFDMMQTVCIRVQEIMDKKPTELQTAP
uniref:Glomulin n=1 Tax=Phallusia mammillata TaxID=59560 RepID=A0A6F9DDV5_9ASCI|nr:glomulin [Phallusia mammillata]